MRFYRKTTGEQHVIFCAYNDSFDHPFVDQFFRPTDHSIRDLHNYTLDLPSIAWGMGLPCLHGNQLEDYLDVESEPSASDEGTDPWEHTGITGARLNLRIYQALLDDMR